MAAIGKIRSKGTILAIIIGLALFSFIAEELFRSCNSTKADRMQQVGVVRGKKLSLYDFQALYDEYQEVLKMQKGSDNLTEAEANQARDYVWNTFVQGQLVAYETEKLGLTVTDEEMQNVLTLGTHPLLRNTPFINQETGLFDANQLKKFLADYETQKKSNPQYAEQAYRPIYRVWTFFEKTLRQQLLTQKYQALLGACFLTNSIEAEALYNSNKEETTVLLAASTYTSIPDDSITITSKEMEEKYAALKPKFRQYDESRNIKYIDVKVEASPADRRVLQKQMDSYAQALAESDDPGDVVRKSTSLVTYLGIPVKKNAYPSDIAAAIDTLAVGATSKVFETKRDNTFNVVKKVSSASLPDSVIYRQIQVFADTPAATAARADSIYNALTEGADFELIAKNYGQTGEEITLTTAQYQQSPSLDSDTKEYLVQLNTLSEGAVKNIALTQGNVIVKVEQRKGFVDKYVCAVVKKTIDFSHETYNGAYNKISAFVSANQTGADIIANAEEEGYILRDNNDLNSAAHNIAGLTGTHEAVKWVFSAKEGQVSPLYECGSNDHLLVVVVDQINKKGYATLDNEEVANNVRREVLKEKKGALLLAEMQDVKSITAAQNKGCKVDTIKQISFAAPVFVRSVVSSEQALAGAVAATELGQFCKKPVVGEGAVYVFGVVERTEKDGEYDEEQMRAQIRQRIQQAARMYTQELYNNAQVVDNRYLFF